MGLLDSILRFLYISLFERRWHYLNSYVRIRRGAQFLVAHGVKIQNATIYVSRDSTLILEEGVQLINCDVYVQGTMRIGMRTRIGSLQKRILVTIDDGTFTVGHHSQVLSDWVWVRFDGHLTIGDYTNINGGGQLRADEKVTIGDYCMISYNVNIWDTNTHAFYPTDKRRELTEKYWPYYGREIEKPQTVPVIIGSDVWIGQNVSILKGSDIGDAAIIGYGCTIIRKKIEAGDKVVPESNVRFIR